MALNVLEVAVYALVLMGADPQPFTCSQSPTGVHCTLDVVAVPGERESINFSNGVRVTKHGRGLQFSNGISATMDSAGWVQFSNGVGVRRVAAEQFRFSNGMACMQRSPVEASCLRVRR